ncbi:hypothetical protein TNIN_159021 [Trichonephila inaurata madagascariensis]|uniref:Ig-like domain-containing protein n=1 Tax=Trichonephila inaurata madagascariensis TaxID=2747483 RepID=A0A8X6J829_9ARAC|nr:hypothetical protein TNIN_159021 [Trichonephila inaurata madagascariensis]
MKSNCGEAFEVSLKMTFKTLLNSRKCDSSENYELNTRFVYAMRCIGKGAESKQEVLWYHESFPTTHKILEVQQQKFLLQANKRETQEDSGYRSCS